MPDMNSQLPVKLTDGTYEASIRNLAANDALNVAIVDGAGAHVTSFGGTQYAEDAVHTTGDSGNVALAVRKDTPVALAGLDGDYSVLETDANGRLHVKTEQHEYAEDAVHTTGDYGVVALAVRKDTAIQLAGLDGDYSVLETDANGRLHVLDQNSAAMLTSLQLLDNAVSGSTFSVSMGEVLSGYEVNDYQTTASLAAAGTANHDTVVTALRTLKVKEILVSASGRVKAVLQTGPVATLVTEGVFFNSTGNPNIIIPFEQAIEVPDDSAGTARIAITNLESVAMDVYSTLIGVEVPD